MKMWLWMYFIRVTKPCFPPNEHHSLQPLLFENVFQNTALMSGRPEKISYAVE